MSFDCNKVNESWFLPRTGIVQGEERILSISWLQLENVCYQNYMSERAAPHLLLHLTPSCRSISYFEETRFTVRAVNQRLERL